jgi:hypothetical protein
MKRPPRRCKSRIIIPIAINPTLVKKQPNQMNSLIHMPDRFAGDGFYFQLYRHC